MRDVFIPLEDDEQANFVDWLEMCGLRFTSVPNSTYTKYMSQKLKNRRLGLRAGFPDLVVLIPPARSKDGKGHLLTPELKRRKGGVVSPDQRAWIDALNDLDSVNIEARVCKGYEEAKQFVLAYLLDEPLSVF